MKCRNCGAENQEKDQFCGICGTPLTPQNSQTQSEVQRQPGSNMAETLSLDLEKRRQIINNSIVQYVSTGFRMICRDNTTAQLVRPKQFGSLGGWLSGLLALGSLVCAFFGALGASTFLIGLAGLLSGLGLFVFFLALLDYLIKKDSCVFLSVDETGNIHSAQN